MNKMKYIPLIICGSMSTMAVAVEENKADDLPTVTVEGKRISNTTVVSMEELKSLAPSTSDTASLLKNIPGLNIQGSGGVSGLPVIHGLADDRLRIKVDGMDLISACGNHMNPALSYIDPSNVGSAQVFAGISPVSSGGDSIGGTILVDSADPEFAEDGENMLSKGEIGAFYRSNGSAQGGNLSATIAGESLSLSYQGSTAKSENYDAGGDFKPVQLDTQWGNYLDSDEVGSTMYKSTNQSVALAYRLDKHLFELKYGEQDIPYQAWVNQRMDMTGNDSEQINLRYEGDYNWGNLEARVYNEHTRHAMQFYDDKLFWYLGGVPCTPGPTCAAGMPMDTEGDNTGATVKAEIPLSDSDLVRVGAESQEYRLDDWWEASGRGMAPDTFWNIRDGERDRLAIFGEWEAQWNSQWRTQVGVRAEQVDMDTGDVQGYNDGYNVDENAFNAADHARTDNNIDLTALARFIADDTQTIEFGFAQKTRSPNLYERYAWSTGGMAMRMINWAGDGNGYVGNLDLEPEVAHTLTATFNWHDAAKEKWEFELTPYYTRVDDYIDVERCSSGGMSCTVANLTASETIVYLQFVNQSATLFGLDVSGHFTLAEQTSYGSFTASGLLNYVHGKNDDTNDNLYNIMPLNLKLAGVQSLNRWTNTVEFELVDNKTDVSEVRTEIETNSYTLIHLRSSYEWKQLTVNVGIENLFDTFYNDPLGGTYLGQGVTMTGVNGMGTPFVPWGTSAPGMGRSVYAGLTYRF